MRLPDFKLERYFDRYEFSVPYLLCCSDCESFSIKEILEMEGPGAVDAFLEQRLGYTEARGNPELRRNIAGLYSTVGPDEVLVFSGAEEAITGGYVQDLRPAGTPHRLDCHPQRRYL